MHRTVHAGMIGLTLALGTALPPVARAAVERPFPLITVTGEAERSVAPDVAETSAGVTTEAKTVREAAEANAQAMTAVIDAVKAAGVAAKDTQTGQIAVHPIYANNQSKKEGRADDGPRIVGYRVSNQVRLKVRDIAKLGDVLDRAMAAGATDVFGISFTVSEPSKALDAVRAEAMADAKRKADIYAKAAGAQVGRAIDISEASAAPRPMARFAASTANRAMAAPTPVAAGENTLHISISVTYELLN
ncbi:MAG: SIMPL domain-containing protein [Variibacter sp.]